MSEAKSPTEVDRCVGKRVRKARRDRGLTQSALGEMIGRTFQQVQKYELGSNRVSAGVLYEIAYVLQKDIAWFFEDAGTLYQMSNQDDASEHYRACVNALIDLRDSSNLDVVLQVMKLAKQSQRYNQSRERLAA